MITIKKLKEELNKFSDDDLCYAYEGEATGLVVRKNDDSQRKQGVIYCSEYNDSKETELIE